ncbi:MAG TPA: hypothetical protein VM260_10920 [Pirellula sp.]|nr:hypothetical protein [Pirellula sp.]
MKKSDSVRRYEEVRIDQVKVINSRNPDNEQFDMNVESIESVGLMKPIRVNDKFLHSTGVYELFSNHRLHQSQHVTQIHSDGLSDCESRNFELAMLVHID